MVEAARRGTRHVSGDVRRRRGTGTHCAGGRGQALARGYPDMPRSARAGEGMARWAIYVKALTARATIRPKSASARVDCTSIRYFARWVSGITSVGLNAVAFVKPR